MRPVKWSKWVAVAGVVVLLTSGCSLLKSSSSQEIDPPQSEATGAKVTEGDGAAGAAVQDGVKITLYMKDPNQYVAPVTVQIPKTESVARKTLEYMVDGAAVGLVPGGFTGLLPKGTTIKGIDINAETKTATVDFSKEFTQYNAADERKILEAVTWALTGFPNVEQVKLWVEGKELKEMPQGHLPIDGTLSRAMGINLEMAEGVEFGQATPVTVYFLGQTEGNIQYFVPVTRMVKLTDDKAKAAMEQLIAGPGDGSPLSSVMASTVQVSNVQSADGIITVNFTDALLGPDQKAPGEALQAVVLSLTELAGDAKVQIKVNEQTVVSTTDNKSYSQPVSRPANVNAIQM